MTNQTRCRNRWFVAPLILHLSFRDTLRGCRSDFLCDSDNRSILPLSLSPSHEYILIYFYIFTFFIFIFLYFHIFMFQYFLNINQSISLVSWPKSSADRVTGDKIKISCPLSFYFSGFGSLSYGRRDRSWKEWMECHTKHAIPHTNGRGSRTILSLPDSQWTVPEREKTRRWHGHWYRGLARSPRLSPHQGLHRRSRRIQDSQV